MSEVIRDSTVIGIIINLLAFDIGNALHVRAGLTVLNPLLVSIILATGFMAASNTGYGSYARDAWYLGYLLTPAMAALAVPLYQQLQLLRDNLLVVAFDVLAGMLTSLGPILVLCIIFHVSHVGYITLLPGSITMAIDMSVVEGLGGYTAIIVASIIMTGTLGNMLTGPICHLFVIHNPTVKGLILGTSAHVTGTSKVMRIGEIEGAMAGLVTAASSIMTVIGASISTTSHWDSANTVAIQYKVAASSQRGPFS